MIKSRFNIRIEVIFSSLILLPVFMGLLGSSLGNEDLRRYGGYVAGGVLSLLSVFALTSSIWQHKLLNNAEAQAQRANRIIDELKKEPSFQLEITLDKNVTVRYRFGEAGFVCARDVSETSVSEEELRSALMISKGFPRISKVGG